MNSELIRELLNHLSGKEDRLVVGDCPKKLSKTIEKWDIPMDLKRLLQWDWINAEYDDFLYLYTVKEIVEKEDRPRFMVDGLLQIGSCGNGDMVVVDFREPDCPIRYVSHDQLWEGEGSSPRDCSVLIFPSCAELLLRLAEGGFIPGDYYSGEEYREVVDGMQDRKGPPPG